MSTLMLRLAIAAGATALSAGALLLVSAPAYADGAVHYTPCKDGASPQFFDNGQYTFTYCFSETGSPSGNGNAAYHGTLISPASGQRAVIENVACFSSTGSGSGVTTTDIKISPSGNVNGTCKFR